MSTVLLKCKYRFNDRLNAIISKSDKIKFKVKFLLDSKIHFLITFCKNQCLLRSTGPVDRNTMTAMVFQNPVNTRKVNVGEMLPETMNILTDFYEPFNEQLAELLGDRHYLYHLF